MRIVVQRVSEASLSIEGAIYSSIGKGLVVLLGIEEADTNEDLHWLCSKLVQLRIFADEAGLMNKSIQDCNGEILLVSQFTLHASTKKGNRPSFIRAARPEQAIPLYASFTEELEKLTGKKIATGKFGADMKVSLCNDGPVTIVMNSKNRE